MKMITEVFIEEINAVRHTNHHHQWWYDGREQGDLIAKKHHRTQAPYYAHPYHKQAHEASERGTSQDKFTCPWKWVIIG